MTGTMTNNLEKKIDENLIVESIIGEEWVNRLKLKGFNILDAKGSMVIFENNQNKKIYLKYDQKISMYSCGILNGSETPIAHAAYPTVLKTLVGIAEIYSN